MRYLKYPRILTFWLLLSALSLMQCSRETTFNPYPVIKGQVTAGGVPVDSATVKLWIAELQSDTLTYITDNFGNYTTERINNRFERAIIIEASRPYTTSSSKEKYGLMPVFIGSDGQNADSIIADVIYVNPDLKPGYSSYHYVTPKRLDFLYGQYISYVYIINDVFGKLLEWGVEHNTEWMSIIPSRIVNPYDSNHLKLGGYVILQVKIKKPLPVGTYDSSILVKTDQGNTVIPVHVVVE
ncbi:MAG: hypothetical protein MUE74_03075 [Bacteroidales bacterium]|jgi:hypothetical protein|nr:hypothetical protein [Bacteroidales bacterium]